ncbi:helix-turn-helix domain-containing protein [Longicatena caecimuris]|uniref:helix-turn-helix domain-containing protein n=1 Tax=Longicatena caecimuris TaxID=1796635 RepID=UPI0018AA8A29|nr:helix-turn-helix transcriptional regulator [Longicatena caecimuris]
MLNERLKELRTTLNLTMEKFGNQIGLSRAAISGFERGTTNPSEQTIKSICREFNVDYFWLTEGIGEMFTQIPQTLIDNIAIEYKLTDDYKAILEAFLEVPDDKKEVIKDFFLSIAMKVQKKSED